MSDLFLGIMLMALHKAMISNPSLLALAYRPSGCVGQEGTPYSNKQFPYWAPHKIRQATAFWTITIRAQFVRCA